MRKHNNSKNTLGNPHRFVIDWDKTKGKKNQQTGEMKVLPVKYLIRSFDKKTRKTITVEKYRKDGSIELVKIKVKAVTKPGKIYYKRVDLMIR